MKLRNYIIIALTLGLTTLAFQNCSDVSFSESGGNTKTGGDPTDPDDPIGDPDDPTDDTTPLVTTVGTVTILLALGDQVGDQLVVKGGSAQLIAQTMVRYASPKVSPKILVVRDLGHNGETAYDTAYIADVLLARYHATAIEEPQGGLKPADVAGYDLIWFNNPGHKMSQEQSHDTLLAFKGGIILSGDDMTQGNGFDMSDITGLDFINNGTDVVCNGTTYHHNNNEGHRYKVGLVEGKIPGVDTTLMNFEYGNDIDLSTASSTVEVIAYAKGGPAECTELRPALVRYERKFTSP